jgi:lambda repressor-like predicted transcriptional regulator
MAAFHKLALLIIVALVGVGGVSSTALAGPIKPDSAAPSGAAPDWLPSEAWVMERWVPFDERKLEAIFGEGTTAITATLDRTGVTLNQLARQRRIPVDTLAQRLVASRHLSRRSKVRATLMKRTKRMLSQSHLAVHMLSHIFHTWTVTRQTESVFGVSQAAFSRLYFVEGLTMQQIAAAGGVRPSALRAHALHAAAVSGRRGVRINAMSARENRVLRARDKQHYLSWAAYHVPVRRASSAVARAALCTLG